MDEEELEQAPAGIYTSTRVVDMCALPSDLSEKFDLIICCSILEHVTDTEAAISGLAVILAPDGR